MSQARGDRIDTVIIVTVWPKYPVHVYVCRCQFTVIILAITGCSTHRTSHSFVAHHLVVSAFVHETCDLFLFGLSDPKHDGNDRVKKDAVVVYLCFNERALTRSEGQFEFSNRVHTKIMTEALITRPHEARRFVTPGNRFYCLYSYT